MHSRRVAGMLEGLAANGDLLEMYGKHINDVARKYI